jgi:flagellar hook-length control protein FliK
MSSQLNSSHLARAAEQSAKAHAQAAVLRKTDGDSGMLIGGDAFAQVFASTQESQKPRKAAAPKADEAVCDRPPTDRTSRPVRAKDTSVSDKQDAADDTRETSENEPAEKPKVETKQADKKEDKHECKKSKDDKQSNDDAKVVADAQQAPKADPVDVVDLSIEAATEIMADQPDTNDAAKAAAAFALPPALKAQEAAGSEATEGDTQNKEQEVESGKSTLADLLSFRTNTVVGAEKARKDVVTADGVKPTERLIDVKAKAIVTDLNIPKVEVKADVKADAPVVEAKPELKVAVDAKADVKVDLPIVSIKAEAKADLTADVKTTEAKPTAPPAPVATAPAPEAPKDAKQQAPVVVQANANVAVDGGAKVEAPAHETAPKKEFNPEVKADVKVEAEPDTKVSQSPPAAGGRVNAQMGCSAPPPPTGPGSGSPPSVKAGAGVETVINIGALNTSARIDGGAVIQLAKAKTDSTIVSTPTEQVNVSLSRMLKSGGSSFEVQLNPAELGKVDIKIDITKDGVVNAVVTSDNPQTHDLLQKDAKQLEKVFQQAGLNTDGGSLNFQLRGEAQQQQQANQNQQENPHWKRWMNNTQNVEAQANAKTEFYATAPGRVDMMI